MDNNDKLFCAIDIGSHSFKLAIANLNDDDSLELLHLEEVKAAGVKKGAIVNMSNFVEAMQQLKEQTQTKLGFCPKEVEFAYTSESIEAINSSGVAAIGLRGKGRTITEQDKQNVIDAVQAIVVAEDREITHIIPLKYTLDNQEQVDDPINRIAVRLEAEAHIITVNSSLLNNLKQGMEIAGFKAIDMIYSPLAAGEAGISEGEKTQGVLFIDIGSATTKITFFKHKVPCFNSILPVGANNVTNDLAQMLHLSEAEAEELKLKHGCAYRPLLEKEEFVYLQGGAERGPDTISEHYICDIITARIQEIFGIIANLTQDKGWLKLSHSVVLSGGGANLPGVTELAGKFFELPTHTAVCGTGFNNLLNHQRGCQYATVLGLLKKSSIYKTKSVDKNLYLRHNERERSQGEQPSGLIKIFKNLTKDFF